MQIRGLVADPCVDQHLGGLDIGCFNGNTVLLCSNHSEHFATDFPRVVTSAPWVGMFCAGKGAANVVDEISAHVLSVAVRRVSVKPLDGLAVYLLGLRL